MTQVLTPPKLRLLRVALDSKKSELIHEWLNTEDTDDSTPEAVDGCCRERKRGGAEIELLTRKAVLLGEIVEALRRFASGSYGLCTQCGSPISFRRLSDSPWEARCVACKDLKADTANAIMAQSAYAQPGGAV